MSDADAISVPKVFERYGEYVSRLDDFCRALRETYWEAIRCRPGCVACCSEELTVFPVEAAWIRRRIQAMPAARRGGVEKHLEAYRSSDRRQPCSFLARGRCLVYAARPLLCRTEGFALARRAEAEGKWLVSACPRNFEGMDLADRMPQTDLINLDSLNQSLAVLNHAYVKVSGWKGEERVRLSRVLLLPLRLE